MKVTLRKNKDRGHGEFDWLKSAHSFSFGNYYDPNNMGFGALLVLNDDEIAGGGGFPPHSHRDMEIFTIPLTGALSHQDSMENASTIIPGQVQIMSAGTGVTHSEYNASETEALTLLQIWITPHTKNLSPRYDEKHFNFLEEQNILHTLITPHDSPTTLRIFQEAYISLGKFDNATMFTYTRNSLNNGVYIFVIEGEVDILGNNLHKRDALMVKGEEAIDISVKTGGMILVIEVVM